MTAEAAPAVLTFRLQHGPNVAYWIANPADPNIWDLLDCWAAAGKMVLVARIGNSVRIVQGTFALGPELEALRSLIYSPVKATYDYVRDVLAAIKADGLRAVAFTDLPQYPSLQNLQSCVVCTHIPSWPVSSRALNSAM